jgi:ankyrin repeat protein
MAGKQPKRRRRAGVDEYGRTPLHYAAAEGDVRKAREILHNGADPNAQDDNGWSPLHFAAQAQSVAVATLLLAAGANLELRDSFGNTALWRAVFNYRGNGETVTLLLSSHADPCAPNDSGVSPVALARRIGNYDVRKFFKGVVCPSSAV